jgi:Mg-chelatase subunit ChlD
MAMKNKNQIVFSIASALAMVFFIAIFIHYGERDEDAFTFESEIEYKLAREIEPQEEPKPATLIHKNDDSETARGDMADKSAAESSETNDPKEKTKETTPLTPNTIQEQETPHSEIEAPDQNNPYTLSINTDSGLIKATLARGVTDEGEPVEATDEFSEDDNAIFLAINSSSTKHEPVQLHYFAVDVEHYQPNENIANGRLNVLTGQLTWNELNAPPNGFTPGSYQVEIETSNGQSQTIPFTIEPRFPWATRVSEVEVPTGYNIALDVLGGKIETSTSQYDDDKWSAQNLIDGTPFLLNKFDNCNPCGWSSSDASLPQEVVLSFYHGKEAHIAAVIVQPTTGEAIRYLNLRPKHVEVWVSSISPDSGFERIATARLHFDLTEQLIDLPDNTHARFLKLVLLSNFGGNYTRLGEVKVIEAQSGQKSILEDRSTNIALAPLGGVLAYFTSSAGVDFSVGNLIDGKPENTEWRSYDAYFPQDFILAFKDDQSALIDQIVLTVNNEDEKDNWPRRVSISVSSLSPLNGFEEIGSFDLVQQIGSQRLPINRHARFVKIRILENFGGRNTSLNEIAVIEGRGANYTPILLRKNKELSDNRNSGSDANKIKIAALDEVEPNNSVLEGNTLPIGKFIRGSIEPLGEVDFYCFETPVTGPGMLTFDLIGNPNIRTSLTLLDEKGQLIKSFDPGRLPREKFTFSWKLDGKARCIEISEPPVSVVLVWDTSESMKGKTEDLEQAVISYIEKVPGSQRINLIRFSNEVEVLLDDFTVDKEQLKSATQNKFKADGGTSFNDAIAKAIELLEPVKGNRALVVMSDGADTGSRLLYPEMWKLLAEKRVRLYAIGLGQGMKKYLPQLGSSGERILGHLSLAMNGRLFFAEQSNELDAFYKEIAKELHAPSVYYIKPQISQGMGSFDVVSIGERIASIAAPQVELILDASGSMRERKKRINGKLKIDVAKDVLRQVVRNMPEETHVALRVYGRTIREGQPGDCEDTELIYPFAKLDKTALYSQIVKIKALGTTPIAYTLEQAAYDFGKAPGEKIVILITDGKEECGGFPQDVVVKLKEKGIDLRVNVVGFALSDESTKRDMNEVARLTGGRFFDASDQTQLIDALELAMAAPFELLDGAGERVAKGSIGSEPIDVPEGVYQLVVQTVGAEVKVSEISIKQGHWTRVTFKKEGQEVGKTILGPIEVDKVPWAVSVQYPLETP